ncbi:MAG: glycosyltransferase family 2 protein [Pirellula sp.]|jgi:glycosyltransferase involved in cell wall biosynthesis|nr:glycosyltransferase family 2 protein [Pirellula sp.]
MIKVIIQIPCFNEANTLPFVLGDLPKSIDGVDCIEVLVIDDGSGDGTAEIARSLGVQHVISHRVNRGLAAAFATGMTESLRLGATVIVNTDGDHQYPGRFISDLVEPILDGRADVVVGNRNPELDRRNGWFKRILYWVGRRTVSWLVSQPIPDPVSGFRAYSAECATQMHIVTTYSYTLESLVQCIEKGFALEFVPIETNSPTRPSRLFKSHASFIARSGTTLLRVFFMFHPLKTLMWLSLLLAVIGTIPIVRFVFFYLAGNGNGHLQSLVLGAALLVLAAIVLVAGLLADLISQNRRLIEKHALHQSVSEVGKLVSKGSKDH